MPYRTFVNIGLYSKAGDSETSRARSIAIARQWINRHGQYKSIALLQVLIQYPYLFHDFYEPEQDYDSIVKQLSRDCLELIGDDIIEIHESAVKIRRWINEILRRLEQLNTMISNSDITPSSKLALSAELNKGLDGDVDSVLTMVNASQRMLDGSVERLIACRSARDLVEEALAQQISDQWYNNTKGESGGTDG